MSAMFAGIAFTVVFSIPALVREIRLARRSDRPPAVRGPGPQLASASANPQSQRRLQNALAAGKATAAATTAAIAPTTARIATATTRPLPPLGGA
jgi:hypothetical protein